MSAARHRSESVGSGGRAKASSGGRRRAGPDEGTRSHYGGFRRLFNSGIVFLCYRI